MRWAKSMGFALLSAAALMLFLSPAEPAFAQTPQALVGNLGQTDGNSRSFANDQAQAFTTGSNPTGYTLNGIDVEFARLSDRDFADEVSAAIYTDPTHPESWAVGKLTIPSVTGTDLEVALAAPEGGIHLRANTTYWLVWDVLYQPSGDNRIRYTSEDAEDAGAASGFSIADNSRWKVRHWPDWTESGDSMKIRINGAAREPETKQAGRAVVGNLEQPNEVRILAGENREIYAAASIFDVAQAFTTGGSGAGYTLHRVDVGFAEQGDPNYFSSQLTVTIASDSGGSPGATVGRLANPADATFTSSRVVTFTASAGGIDLDPDTTYWLVFDISGSFADITGAINLHVVQSGAEDANGAPGWSIADSYRSRNLTSTAWSATTGELPFKIRLHAAQQPQSAPAAATLFTPGHPVIYMREGETRTLGLTIARPITSGTGPITVTSSDSSVIKVNVPQWLVMGFDRADCPPGGTSSGCWKGHVVQSSLLRTERNGDVTREVHRQPSESMTFGFDERDWAGYTSREPFRWSHKGWREVKVSAKKPRTHGPDGGTDFGSDRVFDLTFTSSDSTHRLPDPVKVVVTRINGFKDPTFSPDVSDLNCRYFDCLTVAEGGTTTYTITNHIAPRPGKPLRITPTLVAGSGITFSPAYVEWATVEDYEANPTKTITVTAVDDNVYKKGKGIIRHVFNTHWDTNGWLSKALQTPKTYTVNGVPRTFSISRESAMSRFNMVVKVTDNEDPQTSQLRLEPTPDTTPDTTPDDPADARVGDLTATDLTDGGITLSWPEVAGVAGYEVRWWSTAASPFPGVLPEELYLSAAVYDATTYDITGLDPASEYRARVYYIDDVQTRWDSGSPTLRFTTLAQGAPAQANPTSPVLEDAAVEIDPTPVTPDTVGGADDAPAEYAVDPTVIDKVKALAAQTHHGVDHVNRWNRVLVAFGEHDGTGVTGGAMTADDARDMADRHSSPVWDEVVTELTALEAWQASQDQDQQEQTLVTPTPVLSIGGGSGVTEGGDASFTITATPAPASPITVKVGVSESGDFGASGSATVTVSGASTTYTITTTNDDVDEPDGSVTATLQGGDGYTVSSSAGSATVSVADDDDPPPIPELRIGAGGGVTEGGTASFTITASPAPASPLAVKVGVSESGDFGASGSATVTVSGATTTYTVTTTDDATDEPDGSVTATLQGGEGYTVSSSAGSATVGVADDDDPPPIPELRIGAGGGVTEGGTASFTITASPAPASPIAVKVGVSESGDFGASGSATVTVSGASTTYTITTTNDDVDEPDGSVTATLQGGEGYTVSSSAGSATVGVADDDDPPPEEKEDEEKEEKEEKEEEDVKEAGVTVSIDDARGVEGGYLKFTVRLSEAAAGAVTVQWNTATAWDVQDNRARAGEDYERVLDKFVFEPGVTELTGEVWLVDDGEDEKNEYFAVELFVGEEFKFRPDAVGLMTIVDPVSAQAVEPGPEGTVSDDLLSAVEDYSEESHLGEAHVETWLRVLHTLRGTANDATIVLPGEAAVHESRDPARWGPVLEAIRRLEEQAFAEALPR